MKKNRFFGRYYKFISLDGYSFAFIKSVANEGDMLQLITKEKAFFIYDLSSIEIKDDVITFNINQDGLSFVGSITLGELHPLSKKVMGPFTNLPLECYHFIDSMYHSINGSIKVNGKDISFDGGRGYIEGDKGTNFPKKYIWYNSVLPDATITLAIASIPLFKIINFTGILCFIKTKDKEYYLSTYNFTKAKTISEELIVLKKGQYQLSLYLNSKDGHKLKAPIKGNMVRYIKENICIPTSYSFSYKGKAILDNKDDLSSLEYMWEI